MADHHHVVQFRSRLALDLIGRATRRGVVDDLSGAASKRDLDLAERIGRTLPDSLAAARLNLADRVAEEVRVDLDAGDPGRVPLERIEDLSRHKISGPALRRSREIAEAWQVGDRGRAAWRVWPGPQEQLDRAERLAGGAERPRAQQAVAAVKIELEESPEGSRSQGRETLYAALSEGKWPQILSAAEAVLVIIPEHPAARQSRSRAWQQIAAIGPGAAHWPHRGGRAPQANPMIGPGSADQHDRREPGHAEPEGIVWLNGAAADRDAGSPPKDPGHGGNPPAESPTHRRSPFRAPMPARPLARVDATGPKGRFLLWVDAVGGYLVCLDDRVLLGRAGPWTARLMSRSWAIFRGTMPRSSATATLICCKPITRRSSTTSRSSTRLCSTTAT